MAFLILAAQYERWSLPLSVMLALPFGTFGALAAIWINNLVFTMFGRAPLANDVYFQIGLVTLLGLAAKNAILIVEYALLKTQEGLRSVARGRRWRPRGCASVRSSMTSLAFILGVLAARVLHRRGRGRAPLASAPGVMGGMLAATFLAIFFVPFFYKLIMSRQLGGASLAPATS